MDPHAEDLIRLVGAGAGLAEVAQDYGVGADRVRRILGLEALDGRERLGEEPTAGAQIRLPSALRPAIDAMLREGMRHHEIAEIFATSTGSVHRVIRERAASDAPAQQGREYERSPEERLLRGLRAAAAALSDTRDQSEEP